jgi:predicted nucleic acid-binding protein
MSAALAWRRWRGRGQRAAVDASARRWRWPEAKGPAASGFADRFRPGRAMPSPVLEALAAEGAQFDLVICDPPAFAPAKPALEAGLRAYERVARLAAPLVAPGGYLGCVPCSHAADLAGLSQCQRARHRAGRAARRSSCTPDLCRARPSGAAATGRKRVSQGAVLPAGWVRWDEKAVLDACVLYPTVLREILQGAAQAGLYQPVWSDRILREWVLATAKLGPEAPAIAEGRGGAAFCARPFRVRLIREHPEIEARLLLPDPNDLHVLATAIAGGADAIVTFNAQDFPGHVLAAEGITRRDPDGFLWELQSRHPDREWPGSSRPSGRRPRRSLASPVTLKGLLKRAKRFIGWQRLWGLRVPKSLSKDFCQISCP